MHDLRALWDPVSIRWAFLTVPNLRIPKGVARGDVPFFDILEARAGKVARARAIAVVEVTAEVGSLHQCCGVATLTVGTVNFASVCDAFGMASNDCDEKPKAAKNFNST